MKNERSQYQQGRDCDSQPQGASQQRFKRKRRGLQL